MNKETDNITERRNEEEEFDIKKILYLLLRQWKWFLLCGILGLSAAVFYSRITNPQYSISTSILVPEKTNGMDMKSLFDGALDMPKNNLYNQVEIIQSYFTINTTLENLNWRTSWQKKGWLTWSGIYKKEPFEVQESAGFVNPQGIRIYITPTSDDSYSISADGKANLSEGQTEIKFTGTGQFGHPFVNTYFRFTLLKKISNSELKGEYCFVFNDLNTLTLQYQKRLQAKVKDKNSDIIECSIKGEEPVKECEFLNELIHVYVEGKMNVQNEAQRRSLDFINTQLTGISDSLNTAGDKFSEFRSKNKIIDLGTEGTLVMNSLKDIETERAKDQIQLDYFQNVLSYLNQAQGDMSKIVSPSVVGIEDASLNALVIRLSDLYSRRQVLSFSAKQNNPTLLLIDKELAQIRSQLNENLRNLIENATKSINSLKERQNSISAQMNKLPKKEQQMINIQREFTLTNEIYTFLLQKRAETNIALASSISDVQIVDVARPQTALQIGLSSKIILTMGFIFGLAIPAIIILFLNFFDDRIHTQEDIENHTSLPILGNIMHNQGLSDLAVFENPKSNIAESFRTLRTNLQFMLNDQDEKVISIHSCNPGEGKSFNAINLASVLAMNDHKVLLIGADLRKPKIHKLFNLPNEHGLSTYLIGLDTFEQIIHPSQNPNLDLIPAGPIPPNPAEILGKPKFKELIKMAQSVYDYIIIDNAPVSLVTDGIIVSRSSDVNIFVLRYGISHKHQIDIINQLAEKKRISHMGIVVNDISSNSFGYTYYKYYQYEAYQNSYYSDDEQHEKKGRRVKKIRNKNS